MEKLISTGPEKVIFLDIDGVLNSNRSTEPIIAEDMVKRLAHIARKTGASIVLSSSWRYEYARHINSESDYYDKDANNTVILKSPKTESSERTISAPKEIINLLREHKRNQLEDKLKGKIKNNLNLLFFDKNENPIAQDVLSKKFNRFLKDNDLDHIRFHDLRHSHVTLLINSKVPIKVISERVGHSNVNTTLNIYAHTLKEMDSEASDKISEVLFNLG